MSAFRIAIIGRPNVGKSSLTNMLAARKVSIVDPTPGVTRDRVTTAFKLEHSEPGRKDIAVELTDTGGYGVYTVEARRIDDAGFDLAALTKDIERQIAAAVAEADLVVFVIDSQAGVTAQDQEVARLLREGGLVALNDEDARRRRGKDARPTPEVLVAANKVDGQQWEMHALEASMLGFGEPLLVSARNNFRRREFTDSVHEAAAAIIRRRAEEARRTGKPVIEPKREREEMMLAIVGKRNAGKSTLVNTLAGQERMIVSEIPGTTRDAVDVRFEMDGKAFVAIDTAGLRRKKSFQDRIEWFALDRMERAVDRADVALLMIDATVPISHVDHQVGMMLTHSFKPVVIVINKWDLVKDRFVQKGRKAKRGEAVTVEAYESYIRRNLKGLDFAPIAFASGKEGFNTKETIDLAFDLMQQARNRCSTGKLNRLVREMVTRQGPTNKLGSFAKVLFVAQVATSPPTIVVIVTKPEMFNRSYERFLINRFREELPFPEVPIRLILRGRKPMERVEETDAGMEAMASQIAEDDRSERQEMLKRFAAGDASAFFDEPIAFVDEPSNPKADRTKVVSSKQFRQNLKDLPEDLRPEDDLPEGDDEFLDDSELLEVADDGTEIADNGDRFADDGGHDERHLEAKAKAAADALAADDDADDADDAEADEDDEAPVAPAKAVKAKATKASKPVKANKPAKAAVAAKAKPSAPAKASKAAKPAAASKAAPKAKPAVKAKPKAAAKTTTKAAAKPPAKASKAAKPVAVSKVAAKAQPAAKAKPVAKAKPKAATKPTVKASAKATGKKK